MARIHFVTVTKEKGKQERPFDPGTDMAALEVEAKRIPGLAMVLVDPVVTAVKGDSHKNSEVRRGLQPLVDLAQHLKLAVVGITHFAKGSAGRSPLERVIGSIAFGAVARMVMVFVRRSEEQGGGRIMVRAKSNIGPDGDGFAYDLVVLNRDQPDEITRVEWTEHLTGDAETLLKDAEAKPKDDEDEGSGFRRPNAVAWLLEYLQANGPAPAETVENAGKASGFTDSQIRRAREKLCIHPNKKAGEKHGSWYWSLPLQKS